MAKTLTELQADVRYRADMTNSSFISPAELTSYLNYSLQELYDTILDASEDYFTTSTNLTISSGNTVALPTDVRYTRGVDYAVGGEWVRLERFSWKDRNDDNTFIRAERRYRIVAGQLTIVPIDDATGTYRLWYVPEITPLSSGTDTTTIPDAWIQWVVVSAAIKCLAKEESDTSALQAELARLGDSIRRSVVDRDRGEPERIAVVWNGGDWF